ncbi:MAG: helix-turn-helix transcriptional regulator [Peptococcaceae bacterium]|nr:helix-turn-helix transcriptional regulator [Peptococcaceae bacterium]
MVNNRIKELREDKDLKQKDLAEYLRVAQNSYSNYENGNRECPIELLVQLSNYYQVNLEYLLGLTDEPTPLPPSKRLNLNMD